MISNIKMYSDDLLVIINDILRSVQSHSDYTPNYEKDTVNALSSLYYIVYRCFDCVEDTPLTIKTRRKAVRNIAKKKFKEAIDGNASDSD
jgi:hypothetical protein